MTTYNVIGDNYDRTRKADPYIVNQICQLLRPKKNLTYIDVGCGTGNYTIALSERGLMLNGVDPSEKMLAEARSKNDNVIWSVGSAEHLNNPDASFDGAIATLTIHHWLNLKQGFCEIYRVLKSKGNFIVFTATAEQMQTYWLKHYFPMMMVKSTQQMPSLNTIITAAKDSGFEVLSETKYFIRDDLQDLFLYSGKNNPALYLNPKIRQNISSFATLANQEEILLGLKKLSDDILSGAFSKVLKEFDQNTGDYLILKMHKP